MGAGARFSKKVFAGLFRFRIPNTLLKKGESNTFLFPREMAVTNFPRFNPRLKNFREIIQCGY